MAGKRRVDPTVGGAVARFALAGLVALAVVGVISFLVLRDTGTSEALKNARSLTRIVGIGIVEPNISEGLLEGKPAAIARFDRLVKRRVLLDPIERVKLWTPAGRLVYSDEPRLIGERYKLGRDDLATFRTGAVASDISDLSRPENRFERGKGKLLEVYMPLHGPGGQPLLFEAYQQFDSIAASGQDIWLAFAPALIAALIVLELVQLPLASSMARRIRRDSKEREALLQKAVDASDEERRRIAGDLHDGVVQEIAGLSFSLAAAADRSRHTNSDNSEDLQRGAEQARQGLRQLRSLLVDIYPPRLRDAGLAAAVEDLASQSAGRGVDTEVDIPADLRLDPDQEAALFRIAREAIRNSIKHSGASKLTVRANQSNGHIVLSVEDDGIGLAPNGGNGSLREGHLGMDLMQQLARDTGSTLEVDSAPGQGTLVRVDFPMMPP
ncbi:MAG: two-component system, NarL family, sensor kinase [Solirubrobacterales bacterium]|jgi:signal transduction histidine kinase|nr:two-component system, NarL family, sensor kinase [Solirubrobacterales bacterium]